MQEAVLVARALQLQAVPVGVRLAEVQLRTLESNEAIFEAAPSPQGLIQAPTADAEIKQYRLNFFRT